ncbi:hypothetical protein EDD86DRAFT_210377 [Gorgonomyces haynaldii]|nr:hypothetical protein EDD86DRAFT_210377 [Gorgonomyces haynaldii]
MGSLSLPCIPKQEKRHKSQIVQLLERRLYNGQQQKILLADKTKWRLHLVSMMAFGSQHLISWSLNPYRSLFSTTCGSLCWQTLGYSFGRQCERDRPIQSSKGVYFRERQTMLDVLVDSCCWGLGLIAALPLYNLDTGIKSFPLSQVLGTFGYGFLFRLIALSVKRSVQPLRDEFRPCEPNQVPLSLFYASFPSFAGTIYGNGIAKSLMLLFEGFSLSHVSRTLVYELLVGSVLVQSIWTSRCLFQPRLLQ